MGNWKLVAAAIVLPAVIAVGLFAGFAMTWGYSGSDYQRLNRLEAHVDLLHVLVADHLHERERELAAEVKGLRELSGWSRRGGEVAR